MDSNPNNPNNPSGEAARTAGPAETQQFTGAGQTQQLAGAGQTEQLSQPVQQGGANTTYIPPELRPTGQDATYSGYGQPTQQWSSPPASPPPAETAPPTTYVPQPRPQQ